MRGQRSPGWIVAGVVGVVLGGGFLIGFIGSGPKDYSGPKACPLLSRSDLATSQCWAATNLQSGPIEVSEKLAYGESSPIRFQPNRTVRSDVKVGRTCVYIFGPIEESPSPHSLGTLRSTLISMRFVSPEWAVSQPIPLAAATEGTGSEVTTPTIAERDLADLGTPHLASRQDRGFGTSICSVAQQLGPYVLQTTEYGVLADCTDTLRLARAARTRLLQVTAPDSTATTTSAR